MKMFELVYLRDYEIICNTPDEFYKNWLIGKENTLCALMLKEFAQINKILEYQAYNDCEYKFGDVDSRMLNTELMRAWTEYALRN